ncbi:hypothetical protein R5R35_007715 [Gryllus longicercus]|uniref:Prefoldin subunit n=1 Tax=Gryllus longicercus TaxID=2509291 RepID=A0AAN9Z1Z2_9ORTH
MNMDDEKPEASFADVERILNRYNEYQTEHAEMISVLERMESELQRTVNDLDSLRQVGEDSYYYRVSGMPKMKVRDVLPYLQQEKMKKEKQIENLRKKIVQHNEEMTEFKRKHMKRMDTKDMPSTSYAETP